ncbi:anti-sigma factor [Metabacillus malikii]|uniref:Anti-sigma factor n=1 Tax=Metabacillus malikii TaxID=1504265 RepID=A0ABT9ZHP7_9BACI|nr:anti-sigma factor [Metabacillus malikii]MDQ0231796.1 hypothetical protein [Metabacillus malikii]
MNEEFKRKLKAYENGELSGSELEEFEKELEKLEIYQEILEGEESEAKPTIKEEKQKMILKRSKWMARLQTSITVLGLIFLFTIVTSVLTAVYYSWGKPDRVDVYRNVIDYTLTVTDPYGYFGGTSTNTKAFFGLEATRDLNKQVGDEVTTVGEMKVDFLFSMMSYPETDYDVSISQNQPVFSYPNSGDENYTDWSRLEKLPDGTVMSAFLSFKDLIETEEVLKRFEGKDMEIVWLAVDTGQEKNEDGIVFDPIGFPSFPIWHEDDMILESREEEKGLFGSVISEGHSSPDYNIGDQEILHKQFIKTLSFLKKYESKANKLYYGELNLADRIEYLNKNGFHHYGVVVTGPTKEILKLKEENWIREITVDEVELWNWSER